MKKIMYGTPKDAHEFYSEASFSNPMLSRLKKKKKNHAAVVWLIVFCIVVIVGGTSYIYMNEGDPILTGRTQEETSTDRTNIDLTEAIAITTVNNGIDSQPDPTVKEQNLGQASAPVSGNIQAGNASANAPKDGETVKVSNTAKTVPQKSASSDVSLKSSEVSKSNSGETKQQVVVTNPSVASNSSTAITTPAPANSLVVATNSATAPVVYRVKSGDTLYSISVNFYQTGEFAQLVADHNHLQLTSTLKDGMQLEIPDVPISSRKSGDSKAKSAVNKTNSGASVGTDQTQVLSERDEVINHVVKAGESLSSISKIYYGSPNYSEFIALFNHRSIGDNLKAGETLRIVPAGQD